MPGFINRQCVIVMLSGLILSGCGPTVHEAPYRAPVEDINRAPPKKEGSHVVRQGETFYMIAWRYNRDTQELARINGLNPPYALQVGQRIVLGQRATVASTSNTSVHYASVPMVVPTKAIAAPKGAVTWEWPTSGKIIANFSTQNAQKGIDIAGQNGQSVITAAPGVVVYSGSGLRGYGQMVIIKHNDAFLSAYAHNSRLLVKEGDTVKAHEKIAEMGRTDTKSVRLHFEIRKHGQPVDPLFYLPKQG